MDQQDIGLQDLRDRPHDGTHLWDSSVDKHYDLKDATRLDVGLLELIGLMRDDTQRTQSHMRRPDSDRSSADAGHRPPPSKRVAAPRSPGSAWHRTALSATRQPHLSAVLAAARLSLV
jgi:hypothetical protein